LLARIDAMTDVTPAIVALSGSGSETS